MISPVEDILSHRKVYKEPIDPCIAQPKNKSLVRKRKQYLKDLADWNLFFKPYFEVAKEEMGYAHGKIRPYVEIVQVLDFQCCHQNCDCGDNLSKEYVIMHIEKYDEYSQYYLKILEFDVSLVYAKMQDMYNVGPIKIYKGILR